MSLQAILDGAGGNDSMMAKPLQQREPGPHAQPLTGRSEAFHCWGQRNNSTASAQYGETLVGLLVGLGLSLLVLAAGSQMLMQHLKGHRQSLQDSHMHHDLRSSLNTIARELRQAQAIGHAWRLRTTPHCADPFCAGNADLQLQGQLISFGRDRNHNGLLDNNECVGFRLKDHKLQIRTACTPVVWTDLTDAGSLKMTALSWQLQCEKRGPWVARWVTVRLNAQWARDATRALSLSQTISLRNDVPAMPWPTACGAVP